MEYVTPFDDIRPCSWVRRLWPLLLSRRLLRIILHLRLVLHSSHRRLGILLLRHTFDRLICALFNTQLLPVTRVLFRLLLARCLILSALSFGLALHGLLANNFLPAGHSLG